MRRLFILLFLFISGLLCSQEKDQLTDTEKIYGLSNLWSEVKSNYVNYEALHFNWDEKFIEYREKIRNTTSTYEYYRLLQKFCATLKDGHSTVSYPDNIRQIHQISFPLRTALVENKVIISEVYNDSLVEIGIKKGFEILKIDGIDIHEYAKTKIKPYISSSTEHDLNFRTYTYELLKGHKDSLINLTLKSPSGKEQTFELSRKLERNLFKKKPNIDFKITDDNIGILTLNSFDNNNFYQKFDSIYPLILKTKKLVIDNRTNGGGSSAQGYHIIAHLVDNTFYGTFWVSRQDIPKVKASDQESNYYFQRRKKYQPANKEKYKNPIVLLISNTTFSAAEDFTAIFKNLSLGKIIGQPTGGSSGQPIRFSLPGGGGFKVCTERNSFPDGRQFVGIGVQPDILVEEKVISLRANNDLTMLKAIEILSEKK